jgi:hypothetical protein
MHLTVYSCASLCISTCMLTQTQLSVKHTYSNPFNIYRLAQQFEFKATGLLNKCYQGAFGCVVDMPSQFSGFRFAALRGSPLDTYLRPLETDLDEMSPFQVGLVCWFVGLLVGSGIIC